MSLVHLALAFNLAGIAIWALAFWWGPMPDYLDLADRHILRILAGAGCFIVAGVLALSKASL